MSLVHFTCLACGARAEAESIAETSAWSDAHECPAEVEIRAGSPSGGPEPLEGT